MAPWTRQQLGVVAVMALVGAGLFAVGWWGSADEESLSDQATWLSVATAGVVVAMCGVGALLLYGRRAVGLRRRRLLDRAVATLAPTSDRGVDLDQRWIWVPGTLRAHRPACGLARGKQVEVVDAAAIRRRGLHRCEVCGS